MSRSPETLDRAAYLGSSDIAAVLGLSPWKTALDVWLEKTGQPVAPPDPEKEKLFRRGKRMEPVVIDMLRDEGYRIVKQSTPDYPNRYVHPAYEWAAAEIDAEAIVDGELVNVEVKTVHPWAAAGKYGEAGTDEIPVEYAAQGAYGQWVTERQRTLFAVLIGSDNLIPYWLERDKETILGIGLKAVEFWNLVRTNTPPEPQRLEDIHRMFRRGAPTRVVADQRIEAAAMELRQVRTCAKECKEREAALQFEIGCYMLGQSTMEAPARTDKHELFGADGRPLLTVAYQTQSKLDQKRLETEHPEIAAACRKSISFYTFRSARRNA